MYVTPFVLTLRLRVASPFENTQESLRMIGGGADLEPVLNEVEGDSNGYINGAIKR